MHKDKGAIKLRRICKLFTLFLILSTLLILSSCDILYLFSSGIHETEDRLVDQLIQCLETEDKEGMRKLFASAQIENSSTFDSDMEELFSFYDGELEYRGGLVNTTDYSDGIQFSYKFFDMQYVVRTSHTSYEFLILWYVEYDYKGKDLGNVGIW